jgi:hypothetical protein
LHGSDEGSAGDIALQAAKLLRRNHYNLISAVNRDVLRPFRSHATNELAEPRFGILQNPAPGPAIPCPATNLCSFWGF